MDTPPPSDKLRLSDADRIHAMKVLGGHYADGRLDDVEFNDRSAAVADSRTMGDLRGLFGDLPGGTPFDSTGKAVAVHGPDASTSTEVDRVADPDAAEVQNLRKRGELIQTIDAAILGVTLVSFLVLQFVFHVGFAWVVWPSLIVTLSIPRVILKYSDEDEELFEEIKETEQENRAKRLRRAAERMNELESRDDDGL